MKAWVRDLVPAVVLILMVGIAFAAHRLSVQNESSAVTPSAEPAATLFPGHIARCGDLRLSLMGYAISDTYPDEPGQHVAEGGKFVVLTVQVTNAMNDLVQLPHIDFHLDHYQGDAGPGEHSFAQLCLQHGRMEGNNLDPGQACQGWVVFQVPVALDPATMVVYATFEDQPNKVSCRERCPLGQ